MDNQGLSYSNSHNPKQWARQRRCLKYSSRRDRHKASPNGATLRKTYIYHRANQHNSMYCYDPLKMNLGAEFNYYSIRAPNPVELYLNKMNPNIADIESNLFDIVKETKPSEIVYTPIKKRNDTCYFADEPFWTQKNEIQLIYKYTKEQCQDTYLWQLNKYKKIKKKENEFKQLLSDSEFDDFNSHPSKNENDKMENTQNKNEYIAPKINEPPIRGSRTTFHTKDSTPENCKIDCILIDFGCNRWVTGFSTTYHWGKIYTQNDNSSYYSSNKNEFEWGLLLGVNNYSVAIACDTQEFFRNVSKYHAQARARKADKRNGRVDINKMKSGDSDDTNKGRKNKKSNNYNTRSRSPNKRERKNIAKKNFKQTKQKKTKKKNGKKVDMMTECEKHLRKLNVSWESIGEFNGNLNGYYINLNKEFCVEKTFYIGGGETSIKQNSNVNSFNMENNKGKGGNNVKNGILCRYMKITPARKGDNIDFTPYGLAVDLLSKPILNESSFITKEKQLKSKLKTIDDESKMNGDDTHNKSATATSDLNDEKQSEIVNHEKYKDIVVDECSYISQLLTIGDNCHIISKCRRDNNYDVDRIVTLTFDNFGKGGPELKYSEQQKFCKMSDCKYWYLAQYMVNPKLEYKKQLMRYLNDTRKYCCHSVEYYNSWE